MFHVCMVHSRQNNCFSFYNHFMKGIELHVKLVFFLSINKTNCLRKEKNISNDQKKKKYNIDEPKREIRKKEANTLFFSFFS